MHTDLRHESSVEVRVSAGPVILKGDLFIPQHARAVVLFAHGSGSSRFSPRNVMVAESLQSAGFGTLLMDLLTHDEEAFDARTGELRFDVQLLSERVIAAASWLRERPATSGLAIGYFGASTGAGAALVAAAHRPELVRAVVSRGGRPDLAGDALELVRAPTLLIVGGSDELVIELNQQAMMAMQCERRLEIVPDASHLFEEPGALQHVAVLAQRWFAKHLSDNKEVE